MPKKVKAAPIRELTAREKALEFAKNNVPKPKIAKPIATADNEAANNKDQQLNNIEEEKESNFYTGQHHGNTDTGGLADQIE